jgi:hypothetical protein
MKKVGFFFDAGFRQKDPKPFPPVRVPPGELRPGTELNGSGTRSAQTAFAKKTIRDSGSAAPNAGRYSGKNLDFNLGEGMASFIKTQYPCMPQTSEF